MAPGDFALIAWEVNNAAKFTSGLDGAIWPFEYDRRRGAGGNTNTDVFVRQDAFGTSPDVTLTLTQPNGRPGPNAYEIIAFFASSASKAIGQKALPSDFDANIDVGAYPIPGGDGSQANHSYQYAHSAAVTAAYWEEVLTQTGAASAHDDLLCVLSGSSSSEEDEDVEQEESGGRPGYRPPLPTSSNGATFSSSMSPTPIDASTSGELLLLLAEGADYPIGLDAWDEGFALGVSDRDRSGNEETGYNGGLEVAFATPTNFA